MRIEHAYDVPPRALFETLVDPAFLAARGERYGGRGPAAIDRNGAEVVVRTLRQLPLEHVPGPVRRHVGGGTLTHIDVWTPDEGQGVSGTWHVDPHGAPIDLHGIHDIRQTAAGCLYAVTVEVKVRVPIVGGPLAHQIRHYLVQLVAKEQAFAARWVAGER